MRRTITVKNSLSWYSATLRTSFCCAIVLMILFGGRAARAQTCQAVQKTLDGLVAERSQRAKALYAATSSADRSRMLLRLKTLAGRISASQVSVLGCLRAAANVAAVPATPPSGMNCSSIKTALAGLEAYRSELTKELQKPELPPLEKSRIQEQLRLVGESIAATQSSLEECQQSNSGSGTLSGGTAPQRILEIGYNNPAFDETKYKFDWGKEVATGSSDPSNSGTFPIDIGREWVQVLAPNEDYDRTVVGAAGWAIHPRIDQSDFPFDHPFDHPFPPAETDWETSLALDMNPQTGVGPFTFLLSNGDKATLDHSDQIQDENMAAARGLPTFVGLLGVEMDGRLLPSQFTQGVHDGDRLAVFGRWIIDAGHNNYRAEIHPPLMMASASPLKDVNGSRALFVSRPFLTANTYTVDTNQIYNDAASDDGTFYAHMINEVAKVVCPIPFLPIPCSTQVEAHVKVKSYPFQGVQLLHFLVRPPSDPVHAIATVQKLSVSYHFTVRTGCAVQVISSSADTVDVYVVMNSASYHPPPLPARTTHNYSQGELNSLDNGAGDQILGASALADAVTILTGGTVKATVVEAILSRGVQGDEYASLNHAVDMLNTNNAVMDSLAANIPPNDGVTVDDTQPFPVSGWLEVKWVSPILVDSPAR
jgi:hypothetical protein